VLGADKGLTLLATQVGVDAVVVDADGKLHYSADLLPATPPARQ
jgi:hypothetical protein